MILDLLIGGSTGFLSGFLGVGGGFILVPLLIFINVPTHFAIGSSLAYIVFTGVSGTIQHYRQRDCDPKIALPMILGGVITAQLGSIAMSLFSSSDLEIMLSIALVVASIIMVTTRNRRGMDGNSTINYSRNIPLAILIGLTVGFLSGFLGVGGGFILVPLMVLLLKMPIRIAIGTSLLEVACYAASGAIGHLMMGNVDLPLVGILAVGGIVASPLGAIATKKASPQHLREIFAAVLILFAIKLLIPS